MVGEEKLRKLGTARGDKVNEFGKAFLEGPTLAFWIPDKVPDPERGEIFTDIP